MYNYLKVIVNSIYGTKRTTQMAILKMTRKNAEAISTYGTARRDLPSIQVRKKYVASTTNNKQTKIPIPSAPRSGRAHSIFPKENSTRKILQPNVHGANPERNPSKIDGAEKALCDECSGTTRSWPDTSRLSSTEYCLNRRMDRYTKKSDTNTSAMAPVRCKMVIYGVGSYTENRYFVTRTRSAISNRCVTVKTSANASHSEMDRFPSTI